MSRILKWLTHIPSLALPFVPEDDEISSTTSSKYLPAQLTIPRRGYSPVLPSIFSAKTESLSRFSTPGLDTTGTQLELADMDMDLMLETFPDLDAYAQKLLDLLILHPPTADLLRDLRVPGSKSSKRLRLYEQNFIASKSAYGSSQYLDTHVVDQALETRRFNPLLHKANLAVLANFTCTAQESSDNTFQELKEVERLFPTQFGDVVHERNFNAALDLRTQTLILGMAKNQEMPAFSPDVFLQYFFFETSDPARERGMGQDIKAWAGMKDVPGWKTQVLKRIELIRATFDESREAEEIVDFEELANLFPWNEFVNRMAIYVRTRLVEIENGRKGVSISHLVDAAREVRATVSSSPKRLAAAGQQEQNGGVVEDQREVPESVQESDQETAKTPGADMEQLSKQTLKRKENVELLASAELQDAALDQIARIDNMQTLVPPCILSNNRHPIHLSLLTRNSLKIAPFKQLKKKIQQQEREALELPSIISNTAQMKELKRRKTEPSLPKKVERAAPRVGTSLDAQDSIAISKAQIKLLKNLKNGTRSSRLKAKPSQDQEGEEQDDEGSDATQKPPASSAVVWKEHYKTLEKNKNKENDKALALRLPPPASPVRRTKRKRFLDHQEGATRVSQIEDDTGGNASQSKRRQVEKGNGRAPPAAEDDDVQARVNHGKRGPRPLDKGKGRVPPPVEDEEEEEVQVQAPASQNSRGPRPADKGKGRAPPPVEDGEAERAQARATQGRREPRPVEKGKGRASPPAPVEYENDDHIGFGADDDDEVEEEEEEDEEEEEEEDDYELDNRAENEERLRKSRRNLDNTGISSTAHATRVSRSPVRRSNEQSNAAQQQIVRHRGSRQQTPIDNELSDEEERRQSDLQVARVNRLAKDLAKDRYARNSAPSAPKRQIRATWGPDESALLIKMVGEVGCRWATIRDMREPLFRGRTDVQLKDKARNIKFDYLK